MNGLFSMQPAWVVFLILVALSTLPLFLVGRRPRGCPPGPPTLPLLGNLHLISGEKTHVLFQRWAREYGPIFSVILGTKVLIVISSDQIVKDLLDKKGAIYSSRPDSYITNVATQGLNLVMMPYNTTWKLCRKLVHASLDAVAIRRYIPFQDLENKQMLLGFLDEPKLFQEHIRRYTNSLTTQLVFGFRTIDLFDPKLVQLYEQFERWKQLTKPAFAMLVDFYPPLKYLPDLLLPLRRTAKELHKSERELFLGHWNAIKAKITNKSAPPCFAKALWQSQQTEGFSDDLAAHLCGVLLEAGSDTTGAQLTAFVQAMILFPEAQTIAQAEIDEMIGDRMPTLEDAKMLPLTRASVKEICRWMPATLMGIPHAVTKDDEYCGYKIPKGAIVTLNTWAIHMDPSRHPDPRTFDPTRYLKHEKSARQSSLDPDPTARDHFVFGAGRRICPGMDLAENSLFLGLSRLLWAFYFDAALDQDGSKVLPDPDDIEEGLPAHPRPFAVTITARSEQRAKIIREEWARSKSKCLGEDMQWR